MTNPLFIVVADAHFFPGALVVVAPVRAYHPSARVVVVENGVLGKKFNPHQRATFEAIGGQVVEAGDWSLSVKVTWDAWSRMVKVEQEGILLARYAYDGLSRRITREVDGVVWRCYYSDQWRPLEEREDDATEPTLQYYWGARHRDDLVRRDRATEDPGDLDEKRYVLMDYFSPAALTDENGAVTERYAFSAFGVRQILSAEFTERIESECAWEFAFQGQFEDAETGWLDYGYRYYIPRLGRWPTKDPLAEEGGFNLYAMAENAPVNGVDFLGLEPKKNTPPKKKECCCTITILTGPVDENKHWGHSGMAIDGDFFDYGPTDPDEARRGEDLESIRGGQGGRYWCSVIKTLDEARANMKNEYKEGAQECSIQVPKGRCDKARKYWEKLHGSSSTYQYWNQQCTTTVGRALRKANISHQRSYSPQQLKKNATNIKHQCGPRKGELADCTGI